jgi:predicted transcriptional regulator
MNRSDDDRSSRSQVTLRLDRDLLDRVDDLARTEGVDRTELVRRLLADGLAHRRMQAALDDYAAGRRSAWSAAEMAGVDLYHMLDRIAEAGIPYAIDPDALVRLEASRGDPPRGGADAGSDPSDSAGVEVGTIAALRERYRPTEPRLLFVGESSPAGGTHFYLANSNLYRAVREAFGIGLAVSHPPEGQAFLAWFRDSGCWLTDIAETPVNWLAEPEWSQVVDDGVRTLADLLRDARPMRVIVVFRRVAPAVRKAARLAGLDDRTIDVLPFPIRQWRAVFVRQLAGIIEDVLGARRPDTPASGHAAEASSAHALAERTTEYGSRLLHDAMVDVLRRHGNAWMTATEIAREIAADDLWRRPTDGDHPPASQVRARARQYADVFQVTDLGIRLRDRRLLPSPEIA